MDPQVTAPAAPATPAAPAAAAPSPSATPPAAPAAPAAPLNIGEVPAVPAAPAAPAPTAAGAPTPVEYEPTGDPGMDLFLSFIGKQGFGADDPAVKAAEVGDFSLLRAQLALKGDKAQGWEQLVALGEKSFNAQLEASKAKAAKDAAAIHSAVGGAENWAKVQAWAAQNAEPEERTAVNAALKAGGIAAKAMALYLNQLYSGTNPPKAGKDALPNGGATPNPVSPISLAEFNQQSAAMARKTGGRMTHTPEYQALLARYHAGLR